MYNIYLTNTKQGLKMYISFHSNDNRRPSCLQILMTFQEDYGWPGVHLHVLLPVPADEDEGVGQGGGGGHYDDVPQKVGGRHLKINRGFIF